VLVASSQSSIRSLPKEFCSLNCARPIVDYRSQSGNVGCSIVSSEHLSAHADSATSDAHGSLHNVEDFAERDGSRPSRDENWNRDRFSDLVK